MAKTLTVIAVEGRLLPYPNRRGAFVGMRRLKPSAETTPDTVQVPGGFRYVPAGPVKVPKNTYFLRAIKRGDLALYSEPKSRRRSAEKEG